MTEVIDAAGRWILSHAICKWCDRPSWDHFPEGVVRDRYRCGFCGRKQDEPFELNLKGRAEFGAEQSA